MKKYLVVAERESFQEMKEFNVVLHKDDNKESARNMASFLGEKFPQLSIGVYEAVECDEKEGEGCA
ncbi:MAG: hypothetical protein LBC75_01075 [Fibromonadaceae bacterium]|jgi:hypothetical protein|nr:hypothetical protein [Fibromonadaceae bacterium]